MISKIRGVNLTNADSALKPSGQSRVFLFHLRSVISYIGTMVTLYGTLYKWESMKPILKSYNIYLTYMYNYRSISIVPHIFKLNELIVLNEIRFLVDNILIKN